MQDSTKNVPPKQDSRTQCESYSYYERNVTLKTDAVDTLTLTPASTAQKHVKFYRNLMRQILGQILHENRVRIAS